LSVLYFAYGSNMSVGRLEGRIVSCRRIGLGILFEHRLAFHKVSSVDGSGKCDAHFTGLNTDKIIGVLYRVVESDLAILDEIEGVGCGYERSTVTICRLTDKALAAETYHATHIDSTLKPLHWYLEHVLQGARENRMPDAYIRCLESVPCVVDANRLRTDRELSVYS